MSSSEPTIEEIAGHVQGRRVKSVEWCGDYDSDDGLRLVFDDGPAGERSLDIIARATWQDQGYLVVSMARSGDDS